MSLEYNYINFERNKERIINNINNNFDKDYLIEDLKEVLELAELLKARINNIEDSKKIVIKAEVWNKKEGNKKYINFNVDRVIKVKDKNENIEYKYTGKISDLNLENISFNYRKTDKLVNKEIKDFYNYILETYQVDNKEEFEKNFVNAFNF